VDRPAQLTVLICDDVPEMRKLLRETIDEHDGLHVVGEADNGNDAVRLVAELAPDVVLLDLSMPERDGLEAIPLIASASPATGIVVFSGFEASRMRDVALAFGAHSYIEKGETLAALFAAMEAAARPESRVRATPRDSRPRGPWRAWLRRKRTSTPY
jgi:DNA-binding NarL/FixJ family response regulator